MNIKPLHDKFFFIFIEDVLSTNFLPRSTGGIILTDNYDYAEVKKPQWGQVIAIGSSVSSDIEVGMFVLIEPGKWTTRIITDELTFWQSEENFVMMTSDDIAMTKRY